MASIDDILSKGDSINIEAPDPSEAPAETGTNIDSILEKGSLTAQENSGERQKAQDFSNLESFGAGAAQGATLGFGDEMSAALEAGIIDPVAAFFTNSSRFKKGSSFSERYKQALSEQRQFIEDAQQNELAYLGGEVAGTIATTALPGSFAAKGTQVATKAAGRFGLQLSRAANLGSKGQRIARGAAQTIAKTAGFASEAAATGALIEAGKAKEGERLDAATQGAETSAAFSAALTNAVPLLRQTGKLSKAALKTLFKGGRNISDKTINLLADNPKLIQAVERKGSDPLEAINNFAEEVAIDVSNKRNAFVNVVNSQVDDIIKGSKLKAQPIIDSIDDLIKKHSKFKTDQSKQLVSELADTKQNILDTVQANASAKSSSRVQKEISKLNSIRKSLENKVKSPAASPNSIMKMEKEIERINAKIVSKRMSVEANALKDAEVPAEYINILKQEFNDKASEFYNGDAGKATLLSKTYGKLANATREQLDQIGGGEVRKLHGKLRKLFENEKALARYGVNKKQIPPERFVNLLQQNGTSTVAKVQRYVDDLSNQIGFNIGRRGELTTAVRELNPSNPLSQFMTGRSGLAGVIGFWLGGPVGALTATALTSPMATKAVVRSGTAATRAGERIINSGAIKSISELSARKAAPLSIEALDLTGVSPRP